MEDISSSVRVDDAPTRRTNIAVDCEQHLPLVLIALLAQGRMMTMPFSALVAVGHIMAMLSTIFGALTLFHPSFQVN